MELWPAKSTQNCSTKLTKSIDVGMAEKKEQMEIGLDITVFVGNVIKVSHPKRLEAAACLLVKMAGRDRSLSPDNRESSTAELEGRPVTRVLIPATTAGSGTLGRHEPSSWTTDVANQATPCALHCHPQIPARIAPPYGLWQDDRVAEGEPVRHFP